ncbi:type IV pilus assembly protein PilM [Anabaena sp. FACHB-1237]|uniref:type IV pilus assembly protein PilM n=1 Tax=Anabaena sp. FACHB-1237 TaxID=2692769 RepID=UPI0016811C34|nr:type IV pilus assembly protein PilM [Anabaena sp. FACHB-1237]MBD2139765.1 type IV pilus assembly protein PilM [Anabaena sp. FACHB-1237]
MVEALSRFFSKSNRGIGVELAPQRVNVVELRKHRSKIKIESLTTVPVPEGIIVDGHIANSLEMAEIIQEAIAESKTKASRVATSIPGRDAIVRLIPVPSELDDKELHEIIFDHEASLYLPYPREHADIDYQKLDYFVDEDGIEKVKVLLVATPKEVTKTYLQTFQQAGLVIDVLEINSFALIRTIRDQLRLFAPEEAAVLVDIEFDNTEIAIIINGVPQFSRTVPIGTYQLQSAVNRAINLPITRDTTELAQISILGNNSMDTNSTGLTSSNPAVSAMVRVLGELTNELRRSIDFYLSQHQNLEVAQILLAGPGGGLQEIDEFFAQRLSLPTTKIDPIACLSLDVEPDKYPIIQRPGLGIVLGLGMREV